MVIPYLSDSLFPNTSQVKKLRVFWNSESSKKICAAKCLVYVVLFCLILKIHILHYSLIKASSGLILPVAVTFFFNFKEKAEYNAPLKLPGS